VGQTRQTLKEKMDYFYGDQLRATFGFDNPNHAGAWIASFLPWGVWLYRYAETLKKPFKILCWLLSSLILFGGWIAVLMTLSRGAILAGGVSLSYLAWIDFQKSSSSSKRKIFEWSFIILILGLSWFMTSSQNRFMEIPEDRSATNRIPLWLGACQMVVDRPFGVGTGKSGTFYMDWYQALDQNSSYRTMVNSFLTFLTEQGIGLSFLLLLILVFSFQNRSKIPSALKRSLHLTLCASLLSMIISGFFSTILETPIILITFGTYVALALILVPWSHWKKTLLRSGIASALLLSIPWVIGIVQNQKDPWTRHSDGESWDIQPREGKPDLVKVWVDLDPSVFPFSANKWLRELSLKGNFQIRHTSKSIKGSILITSGKIASKWIETSFTTDQKIILIDPIEIPKKTLPNNYLLLIHENRRLEAENTASIFYENRNFLAKIIKEFGTKSL
jgi:hypothetical protein